MKGIQMAIIGGGVMGEVIIKRIIRNKIFSPSQLAVTDVRKERLKTLKKEYKVRTDIDNCKMAKEADVILLAVKPQNMAAVLEETGEAFQDRLVISIAAGITIDFISKRIGNGFPIVRAMPNTPASIGQGMTVWTDNGKLSQKQTAIVRKILGALGEELRVEKEDHIDIATAVSGSGPAYVFEFMEAMKDAGIYLGLPHPVARKMVIQTVLGSTLLAREENENFSVLRDKVTSPGGTTSWALAELDDSGFRTSVKKAISAAYHRAQQLGTIVQGK